MLFLSHSCQSPFPPGSHSPPHFPGMPSKTLPISGPAVRPSQILIWSYSWVFLPPMCIAIRTSFCTTRRVSIPLASLVAQLIKNPPAMWKTWVGKIPWRREWLPTPVFWPGEFHGLYSPWGRKESDTTERLSFIHFKIWITTLPFRIWNYSRVKLRPKINIRTHLNSQL